MNFKRFNGSTWETVQHKIYGSGTDSLTAFPAQIQASGDPLTDYLISGNTLQIGTPSPETPVDVVGCGVRTWNLVDPTVRIIDANISSLGKIDGYIPGNYDVGYFPIIQGNAYTIDSYVHAYFYTIPTIGSTAYGDKRVVGEQGKPSSFIAPITGYCCFRVDYGDSFMANTGSTALPYEPYGYKLPITCGGVTKNIYIGNYPLNKSGNVADDVQYSTQTLTRRIDPETLEVLATPTTEQITVPQISTTAGSNTISVGATVQPSAMSATFKGWHPVQGAKQYDGSEWR